MTLTLFESNHRQVCLPGLACISASMYLHLRNLECIADSTVIILTLREAIMLCLSFILSMPSLNSFFDRWWSLLISFTFLSTKLKVSASSFCFCASNCNISTSVLKEFLNLSSSRIVCRISSRFSLQNNKYNEEFSKILPHFIV